MKAILMSIKPRFVADILNRNKTIEVRKRFPKDYRGWVYIYCTKEKPYLYKDYDSETTGDKVFTSTEKPLPNEEQYLGGKVVARFYCDNVEKQYMFGKVVVDTQKTQDFLKKCCLTVEELNKYLGVKTKFMYAIYISQLEIFDEPKELNQFIQSKRKSWEEPNVKRPPQSWCYVEVEL